MKLCPRCETETLVEPLTEITINIRGEAITVPLKDSYRCLRCGEWIIPHDFDELDYAYREYRKRHGMLQPEKMKEIVDRVGMDLVAEMLSAKKETIMRYVAGGLQDELHDEMLLLLAMTGETLSLSVRKLMKINAGLLIDYLLSNGNSVVLDFSGVKGITHSFANEIVGQFVKKYGRDVVKSGKLTATNYNGEIREILNWIVDIATRG